MKIKDKKLINEDEFIAALILYYLSEEKHTPTQLQKKLLKIDYQKNVTSILEYLVTKSLIKKENGFYIVNKKV